MSDVPGTPDPKGADRSPFPGTALPRPSVERPSGEVERPVGSARLPGTGRDGYTKLPTGPVGVEPVVVSGPDVDAVGRDAGWQPRDEDAVIADDTRLAPWALTAAIVALTASFFVGWGIPIAIVAVIGAIMSLRRPVESRAIARWALVLGLCATVYSLGWLLWAGMQFERLG